MPVPSRPLAPSHRLHALDRDWPETNCELDLWIELAAARGLAPEAMLGFTVGQDFLADQFELLVPPREEIERFYGATVRMLALYARFEDQFVAQIRDGGVVLLETDSFYLPDAQGVSYRSRHVKSSIAIRSIDPAARELDYFHNLGLWRLGGDDYDMVVFRPPHLQVDEIIPPYAELIRFDAPPLEGAALKQAAAERLRWRLSRAPRRDPVMAFAATLEKRTTALADGGEFAFHDWAFHTLRQLGANYELLGSHLAWLDSAAFAAAMAECARVSQETKALQFQLARAVARRKASSSEPLLAEISRARKAALAGVAAGLAALT